TLVSHSRHRYGHQPFMVTISRAARMTMPTTAPLSSGSGSLNGIAAQVSLPSMSASRLMQGRTRGSAGARPCPTGHRPLAAALEQLRFCRAVSRGRMGLARLCQLGVAGSVEGGSAAARLLEPGVEIGGRHRLDDEAHLGKAVAAEICRKARILAGLVGEKVE